MLMHNMSLKQTCSEHLAMKVAIHNKVDKNQKTWGLWSAIVYHDRTVCTGVWLN